MNPILTQYCARFVPQTEKQPNQKPDLETFFTALPLQTHYEKLPYLYDIQNFCLRVYLAMIKKEKICIYSDYDTDAITATASMYRGLVMLGFETQNIEFYAPDRFTEGYGMNTDAVRELTTKFDLIISVDCGINSVQEADIARQTNCDLIITDHHHLYDKIPGCTAVVNCRLAKIYYENNDKIGTQFENDSKEKTRNLLLQIQKIVDQDTFEKIENWARLSTRNIQEFENNPQLFLTESATGVGVAWFCLVWLGYFLDWVE